MFAALERRYSVVVVLDRAPGLINGSPVWVGGKEVGRVKSVGFLPGGTDTIVRVAVTVELPRSARTQVRTDSRARLTAARLIGEQVIDLQPGTPAARVLRQGDTLRMLTQRSARDLAAQAAALRAHVDSTLRNAQQLGPSVRARIVDTDRALASLLAAIADARRLQSSLAGSSALAALRDTAFTGSLQRSREHAAALQLLLREGTQRDTLQGEVRTAMARLRVRADSLSALLDAAASSMSGGFLLRAQRDSALLRAVTAARAQLDSLIAETKRNPFRFFF